MKNIKKLQKIIWLLGGVFLAGCQGQGEALEKSFALQEQHIKVGKIEGVKAHEFGVREYLLSNGLKLIYGYYPQDKNKVYFSALTSGGPQSFEKQDATILRNIISSVDASGAGPFSWHFIKQKNSSSPYLSTVFYDNRQGIEGESSTADFARLLQLFRVKLEDNKISAEQWRFFQKDLPQKDQIINDEWLFSISKPTRHLALKMQTTFSSPTQLTALYRQYIGQKNDFTFFIVGDIAPETVEDLAVKYLVTITPSPKNIAPTKVQDKQVRAIPHSIMQKVARIDFSDEKGSDEAEVRLYFTAPFLQGNLAADEFTLDVLAHTLQIQLESLFKTQGENASSLMVVFHQNRLNLPLEGRIFFECQRKDADKLVKQAFAFLSHWPQGEGDKVLLEKIRVQHQRSFEENLQKPFLFKRYLETRYLNTEDRREKFL